MRYALVAWWGLMAACSSTTANPSAHSLAHALEWRVAPATDDVVTAPEQGETALDSVILSHVLRGLYFFNLDYPSAAIPHFRLALFYDPNDPYLWEQLVKAWTSSGDERQARSTLQAGLKKHHEAPGLNYMAGLAAIHERRFDEALMHLSWAMQDSDLLPKAAPLVLDALLWKHRLGDVKSISLLEAAKTARESFERRAPGDYELLCGLAEAFEDHGQIETAKELYREAQKNHPHGERAILGMVRLLSLQGRYDESAAALATLFRAYPDDFGLLVRMMYLTSKAGLPEAVLYRNKVLSMSQRDLDRRATVAQWDIYRGATSLAESLLRDSLKIAPEHLASRLSLLSLLVNERRFDDCLALIHEPFDTVPMVMRFYAQCLWGREYTHLAMPVAVNLLRATGGDRMELLTLTETIAKESDDFGCAKATLDDLLLASKAMVTDFDATLAHAMLENFWGLGKEAFAKLTSLHQRAPDDLFVTLTWALQTIEHGEATVAKVGLETLQQAAPLDVTRNNALGFFLVTLGRDLDEAEVWLRRAYRLAPEAGFVNDSLGAWFLAKQQWDAACYVLDTAAHLSDNEPEVLLHLGDALWEKGQREAAKNFFLRALFLRPNMRIRQQLEARLSAERVP